jgi:hypothetical protein
MQILDGELPPDTKKAALPAAFSQQSVNYSRADITKSISKIQADSIEAELLALTWPVKLTPELCALGFSDYYRGQIAFDHSAKAWLEWDGTAWHSLKRSCVYLAGDYIEGARQVRPNPTRESGSTAFCVRVERLARIALAAPRRRTP